MSQERCATAPTRIRALFRMAEEGEPLSRFAMLTTENTALLAESLAKARLPEQLGQFLIALDTKVNAILATLQQERMHEAFPYAGRVTQISGENLLFECKEPLAVDDHLELALLLEEFPLFALSCQGKVTARHPAPTTSPYNTVYSIAYTALREEDREQIIRFVFQESRRLIREQKREAWA